MIGYLYWDPSPAVWDMPLPLLNRPILWYGFFFALGFFLAYCVLLKILWVDYSKSVARQLADRLTMWVMVGAVLGARIGEMLFYQDFRTWLHHPWIILQVWEGGLASHGGALGVLIAIIAFSLVQKISFARVLDWAVMPTALAAGCIRIGNFFNQEILGKQTDIPWAVIFGHPVDGAPIVPRHPVQLYEAIAYFSLFALLGLMWKWKRRNKVADGRLAGCALILIFGIRLLLERFKEEQSVYFGADSPLTMGQLLSIPFVLFGCWLLFSRRSI